MYTSDVKNIGEIKASYNGFNVIKAGKHKLIKQLGKWVSPAARSGYDK